MERILRNPIIKPFGTALSAIVLLFALNSCETWRQDCAGWIIVENEIPDITLYVGGEPFERDLFAPPIVLRQTADKNIVIYVMPEDGTIVDANRVRSQTTGRLNAIRIIPLKEGETEVSIISDDDCDHFEMKFLVTVRDTTANF